MAEKRKKVKHLGPEGSENKENIPEHALAECLHMAIALVHQTLNQVLRSNGLKMQLA
jgi:hypothetical protein